MTPDASILFAIVEIAWINLLLSGDNAVVIALACRSLPAEQRRLGISLGAGAAIGLRIVFTALAAGLLSLPLLKFIGGALLLWIAVKLLIEETDENDVAAASNIGSAVRIIVIADMVMSLDNVLAIAAAANGSLALIIFGLLLSMPLIVFGAGFLIDVVAKYPVFVWGGAAMLGWVAGELMAEDSLWPRFFGATAGETVVYAVQAAAALFVVAVGWFILRARKTTH